jgi:hypothetical protein
MTTSTLTKQATPVIQHRQDRLAVRSTSLRALAVAAHLERSRPDPGHPKARDKARA